MFNKDDLLDKFNRYYKKENYSFYYDPSITYQECILIEICLMYEPNIFDPGVNSNLPDNFEIDYFYRKEDKSIHFDNTWKQNYIGHFFNEMIINKNWEDVLVDRAHTSLPNYFKYETKEYPIETKYITIEDLSPYKELIKKNK